MPDTSYLFLAVGSPNDPRRISIKFPTADAAAQAFADLTAGFRAAGLPVAVADESIRRPDLGDYFSRYLKDRWGQ